DTVFFSFRFFHEKLFQSGKFKPIVPREPGNRGIARGNGADGLFAEPVAQGSRPRRSAGGGTVLPVRVRARGVALEDRARSRPAGLSVGLDREPGDGRGKGDTAGADRWTENSPFTWGSFAFPGGKSHAN